MKESTKEKHEIKNVGQIAYEMLSMVCHKTFLAKDQEVLPTGPTLTIRTVIYARERASRLYHDEFP
jgi:hypothetical protein